MEQEEHTKHHLDSDQQQQLDVVLSTPNHQLPTLSQIKIKLPGHCFRSTVVKSICYVILDIFFIIVAYTLMLWLEHKVKLGFLFFPLYWYVQGKSFYYEFVFR